MPKQRTYRHVGDSYFDTAPVRNSNRLEIPASAAATFASFEDPDSWPEWLSGIKEVRWTSPKPFGAGTTRDVDGPGGTISELFFGWEDGRRIAFCLTKGTLPMNALAEEWALTPTGPDSCELTMRYAFECAGPLKFVQRIVGFGFGRMGKRSLANLATFMADNKDRYGEPGAAPT